MTPRTRSAQAGDVSRFLTRVLATGATLLTCACPAAGVADLIVQAPNQLEWSRSPSAVELRQLAPKLYATQFKVAVSPHPAELAVAVLEPGNYHLQYDLKEGGNGDFRLSATPLDATPPVPVPKGTIVLLHGILDGQEDMLHWGVYLAERGYRTVSVDLRGHGASTGAEITYGAWERSDLVQVLDELAKRQLVSGKVGVLGISYGGAIAIQWAAQDPRIESVVALAPFADPKPAIAGVVRRFLPPPMQNLPPAFLQSAIEAAAAARGFDWAEANPLAAAAKLRHPLLLIHGINDDVIPFSNSERLQAVAPPGSQLLRGNGNHVTLAARLDPIAERVAVWFERAFGPVAAPKAPAVP